MDTKKDYLILSLLRQNSRASLTEMSKKTRIPVSTIYDKLKVYRSGLIKKHTSLIDFERMGFHTRAAVLIKVPTESKGGLKEHLMRHQAVNNFLRINNGYDFFVEAFFRTIPEMESFMDNLESKFNVNKKDSFLIVDEFRREDFMSCPDYLRIGNE